MRKKLSRSEARCEAFKLIFEINQHKDELDFLFDELMNECPASVTSMPYIQGVVTGVMAHEDELLDEIRKNLANGWRLERISKVARSDRRL